MANENGNRTKGSRQQNARTQNERPAPEQEGAPVETKRGFVPRDIDPDQYVTVKNGFQGKLVYRSKHTGEKFVWDSFGAEQDMELSELKRARSSAKKFFLNNWFMFDEQWIVDYLGMGQYYKYAVKIEDFDKLFQLSADEIEEAVSKMSAGQKKSVAYRARQLIADGAIDSNKAIATLEKCLETELVDRL